MKHLIAAGLMLAAGAALPEGESPFLKGGALDAEVSRNCASGCLVLSPAEAQMMMNAINAKLQERELMAFEAGKVAGKEMANALCRNRT